MSHYRPFNDLEEPRTLLPLWGGLRSHVWHASKCVADIVVVTIKFHGHLRLDSLGLCGLWHPAVSI